MANSLKKIIPLFMGLCLALSVSAETKTWTGATNSTWSTAGNWLGGVPSASDDVIIPAGKATYPNVTAGAACRYIYIESGARIAGQENLAYEKAFVDLTLPTNRYVRIVPPTQEVYSGDLYTKDQGGTWTNFEEATMVNAGSGSSGNRVYPGATYISLFATNGTNYDAYMGVDVRDATTTWADPFNALSHRFTPGEAIDVWVDNDNKSTASFHFPSGDTEYHYFRENGNIDPLTESITRTAAKNKLLFDASSVTGTGYYDRNFPASGTAMFATGNPTMGLMSVKLFLEKNVEAKYLTPFIYRHTAGAANEDGHGSETILYYNAATKKLFRVSSALDNQVPEITENAEAEINNEDELAYVKPAEGFRLMSGAAAIFSVEPKLLGNFAGDGTTSYYEYNGVPAYNGSSWVTKYGQQPGSTETGSTDRYALAITLTATNDPGVVRIGNFLQRGYVYATVDALAHTLTIANGSQVFFCGTTSWWKGSTTSATNLTTNRIIRIYGCTGEPEFGDAFPFNNSAYQTKKVTNIGQDVVFDYVVDNENGTVSIHLQKPFVLYSNEFLGNSAEMTYNNASSFPADAEAFWVYKSIESTKPIDESSGGAAFILPEALGKYETTIESKLGSPAGVGAAGSTYTSITVSRLQGVYDYVLVDGLYPNVRNYPVVGTITNDGTETTTTFETSTVSTGTNKRNQITITGKRTRYKMTIVGGQLINEISTSDLSRNFFLYYPGRKQSIVFDWYTDVKKTTQAQTRKNSWSSWTNSGVASVENLQNRWRQGAKLQVSYLGANPSSASWPGLYMSASDNCTLIRYADLDEDVPGGEPGASEEITIGDEEAAHAVTFHKDMFAANQADFASRLAALSPARRAKTTTNNNVILNITAQNEAGKRANTLLVYSENANSGFNRYEDAPLFDRAEGAFTLATIAGQQLVGVNVSSDWTNTPLYISHSASLSFHGLDAYQDELALYDAINEIEYVLNEDSIYIVDVNAGEEAGRWFIRAKSPNTITAVSNVASDWNQVAWNPHPGTIVVRTACDLPATLSVYNMAGTCVARQYVTDLATFHNLSTGTYMVLLTAEGVSKQIKIVVR